MATIAEFFGRHVKRGLCWCVCSHAKLLLARGERPGAKANRTSGAKARTCFVIVLAARVNSCPSRFYLSGPFGGELQLAEIYVGVVLHADAPVVLVLFEDSLQ